jgi:hypothetical protein
VAASPYGYWAYNQSRNGLVGATSTILELDDGRDVLVKDPTLPAVLEDQYIMYALQTSRAARADFTRLFPLLDPASQERLTALIIDNPRASALIRSDQDFADAVQNQNVTAGVRTRLTPALNT